MCILACIPIVTSTSTGPLMTHDMMLLVAPSMLPMTTVMPMMTVSMSMSMVRVHDMRGMNRGLRSRYAVMLESARCTTLACAIQPIPTEMRSGSDGMTCTNAAHSHAHPHPHATDNTKTRTRCTRSHSWIHMYKST